MHNFRKSLNKFFRIKAVFWLAFFILSFYFLANSFSSYLGASTNKINLYPGLFNSESKEDGPLKWSSPKNILIHDLSSSEEFEKFTQENSAYIVYPLSSLVESEESELTDNIIPGDENTLIDEEGLDEETGEVLGEEESIDENLDSSTEILEESYMEVVESDTTLVEDKKQVELDNQQQEEQQQEEVVAESLDNIIETDPEPQNISSPSEPEREPSQDNPSEEGSASPVSFIKKGFESFLFSFYSEFANAQEDNSDSEIISPGVLNSLILSGFNLPSDISKKPVTNVSLNSSLAFFSEYQGDKLLFEYSLDGTSWSLISEISGNKKIANINEENYFSFSMPLEKEISNLADLKIRISYINDDFSEDDTRVVKLFLDATWIELDYEEIEEEEILPENLVGAEEDLETERILGISKAKSFFSRDELPNFSFNFKRTEKSLGSRLRSEISGIFVDQYKDIEIEAFLKDSQKESFEIEANIRYLKNGNFEIDIDDDIREFKPGKYSLEVYVKDGQYLSSYIQDFSWGVLALNINKSIFDVGETAYFQVAVLDELGDTLCNADLILEIENPSGEKTILSTSNGEMVSNSLCGANNYILEPDYYAYYNNLSLEGEYSLNLLAETQNGYYEISDVFYVEDNLDFNVERVGPTRIYPLADYEMSIRVLAREDFSGQLREYVPKSFVVKNLNQVAEIIELEKEKIIIWDVDWQVGGLYEYKYVFDAPDVFPEFYLLGPAEIAAERGNTVFKEKRKWQIASDAVSVYEYDAGTSVGWTNAANAWDQTNNTYATRSIPRRNANDSANYLEANANNVPSFSYSITNVQIGIEGYVQTTDVTAYLLPRFGGSTNGTAQTIAGATLGTTDSNNTYYVDITNDGQAPATWTWSDVQNLDVRVYGSNSNNGQSRTLYVDQVRVMVEYTIPNDPPTGTFVSVLQKNNGSGVVDASIEVDDPDDNDTSAKIEYEAGSSCSFVSALSATLSEVDGDTTADFGDPDVLNVNEYQIGNANAWIETASGTNTVHFDWLSKNDVPTGDGDYCLRLTVNDGTFDQTTPDTQVVTIDNVNPTAPGSLSVSSVGGTFVNLDFGSASTDTNFDRYVIYYKMGPSGATTTDSAFTSADMYFANYNGTSTAIVEDLFPNTEYVFNIWAYDEYGNYSNAPVEVSTTTLDQLVPPISSINSVAQKTDGSGAIDFSIEIDDGNDDDVRVRVDYEAGTSCSFTSPLDPTLDETPANISASTGTVIIDNNSVYQVGTSTGWIKTDTGANTVLFDWLSKTDIPTADGVYCVRITANDDNEDQTTPTTQTLLIDNVAPSTPGNLSVATSTDTSITLNFGAQSTDTNFTSYKIFYKKGTSGVSEGDIEHIDSNLAYINYNGEATTRLNNLDPDMDYVFNIWAYDDYGNKSWASEQTHKTALAVPRRANTVAFVGGAYSGDGSTGQSSDTDNTFSAFNFKLAEQGAEIKNAYIVFEARFEAYANNAGNYSGYNLAFDACESPCTANAFSGTGRVLVDDNSVLAYDETESNDVRLIFDVSNETQLANYSGEGVELSGQIGYRIERGATINSISYASAKLVVTYVYNGEESENLTNTVYYPLDSNVTGDSGTRLSSQANNCTLNSNCPLFSYNMEIPEFSEGLSNWFKTNTQNELAGNPNNTDDFTKDVNIQTYDINSSSITHEVANAGGQGNPLPFYFESVSGLTPNTAQTLEMRLTSASGYSYYLLGGEVAMTYVASSSASEKTRTVSFPLGVVNNGGSTALSSASANVYFPENGASNGVVSVKSAWFRIVSNDYQDAAKSVTVSSIVGNNTQSGNYVYNYDPGRAVVNPVFDIKHIIPSTNYAELALANGLNPKSVTLNTTNGSTQQGGLSAELVITYTYTDESNGYLSNLNIVGGQSTDNGNSQLSTSTSALIVAPEIVGEKTIRGGQLEATYLFSDSSGTVGTANATLDTNISAGIPVCTNAYQSGVGGHNSFARFYKSTGSIIEAVNNNQYNICYSNNGVGSGTGGAKMNAIVSYIYQYTPPSPVFSQNDWRWYENIDLVFPSNALENENTTTTNVYLTDVLRLRMNVLVEDQNMATSSESFKLQFGEGSDCSVVSIWEDVGGLASIALFRGYNNPTPVDGVSASSTLLASSTIIQTYEEENPSATVINYTPINNIAEWDWVLYNYNASPSTDYCFRMVRNGNYTFDNYLSYPQLTTAPANTAPSIPSNLSQYKNDSVTEILNEDWVNEDSVNLRAQATDPDVNEIITLYFELIENASSFTTATTEPTGACVWGTAYNDCASKIWFVATSSADYFRYNPYIGEASITAIPDGDYKWQTLSCDLSSDCSSWVSFNTGPNFRIDTTSPTAPGSLGALSVAATSVTVSFGAQSTENNFYRYRIFYKIGLSGVTESNSEYINTGILDYQNYNGETQAVIGNLTAGTNYVFNIWAYDLAGNKASSTLELATTTLSAFTPPTGNLVTSVQKTDGTGAVDIVLRADDEDNDDTLRAKIEYVAGASCDFTSPNKATIDEREEYITADYGDPRVDNNLDYQIGTSTGWIITSPGENYVSFDWLAKTDVPGVEGTYCIRSTVNDGTFDQDTPSTRLVLLDTINPTAPGALTLNQKNSESVVLNFGAKTVENNFQRYRIYYSTSTPVTEDGNEHSDINLLDIDYNFAATTTVEGLTPGVTYYFNIWAYDNNGNNASSSELEVTTNYLPNNLVIGEQYWSDGMSLITNGSWINNNDIYLSAWANDQDSSEILTVYFELIEASASFTTATSVPSGACAWGEEYNNCSSKIWFTSTSTPGDFSVTPFYATSSITNIPDSSVGYKWQAIACDDDGGCVPSWLSYNTEVPNFRVDITPPSAPGSLVESSKTSSGIDFSFGSQTDEDNFSHYKIFYSTSTPVSESDFEHTDSNLNYINYNGASITSVSNLLSNTLYYFNIWAYDEAGNKTSSTETAVSTNPVSSTPGVFFYTKNTRVLYYRYWNGADWSAEQTGPTMGSGAGDNIRHIDSLRSDDGARVAVVVKTWDGTNQEWWGTVYRYAANDFVNTAQLGSALSSATDADKITSCIGSLSGKEFMVARNNNSSAGIQVYKWDYTGWSSEGAGPGPSEVVNGCRLVRRPATDNYLLITFDNYFYSQSGHDYYGNVGSAYYYGGSSYSNNWTTWTKHSNEEEGLDNYVGEAFFNPSDNTKGAINYSNSDTLALTKAKYFEVTNSSISYGAESNSPESWSSAFVHGEFAVNPGSNGIAYYIGDDINGEINVYKTDISGSSTSWSIPSNSDNISSSNAYSYSNNSQKPYDMVFYENDSAVALWNENSSATPKYRQVYGSSNSLDSSNTAIPGSSSGIWSRVRAQKDPSENEFIATYQSTSTELAVVFWDGFNTRFFNSSDNPGSNQIWTTMASGLSLENYNDDASSFSFAKINTSPTTPSELVQYKGDGTTMISNGSWTNTNDVYLEAAANDSDTSEIVTLYFELIDNSSSFTTSIDEPVGACSFGETFDNCTSKIWFVATSTANDFSIIKYKDKILISDLPDSSVGYKWQVMACDQLGNCSNWTKYNLTTPNLRVDTISPIAPGALTDNNRTSSSIILGFGAQSSDINFSRYRIFYATSSPVSEFNTEHSDSNLLSINYGGASETTIYNLKGGTTYYVNIWAYDLAGNKASSTQLEVTTSPAPYLEQVSYLIENDDGATVNNNSSAISIATPLNNLYLGERVNIRLQLENTGGDFALNKAYKIQFENQTDSPGTWIDIGELTDISRSLGLSGSNGSIITSAKAGINSNTWTNGTWHENTDQTGLFTLATGAYTEFVFALDTRYAQAGKTYRLRLYNMTDNIVLDAYSSYPTISTVATDTIRYSKASPISVPSGSSDLDYFLDPEGYSDISLDDGNRDVLTTSNSYPIYNFASRNSTSSDAINIIWNGQSSISGADAEFVLQAYRFGSVNSWITLSTNSTSTENIDFDLEGQINSNLSDYYDINNRVYFRLYQNIASSTTLSSDYLSISFVAPSPEVNQIHYRFRDDDGSESTANWREAEDTGDPMTGVHLEIGENIRLRMALANIGAGDATNYDYDIQYALTTTGCSSDPGGWVTIPVTATTEEWEMATSSNFSDGTSTTAQLSNSESYNFVSGTMVQNPSNSSGAISLSESDYTEIEYAIKATVDAYTAGTYCFRVVNNGSVINKYDIYPELTLAGILNTAPTFDINPSDGGSATSTPTNFGQSVNFSATAIDNELDDYYLAICKTNNVQAGNDGPPVCTGGEWCTSGLTANGESTSCSYETDTALESLEWYAFVCDKYPGVGNAKCSASSQGEVPGASNSSPFVVNHPPLFSSVITSDNNKDPGSTFTISTVSSDPDTLRGDDLVYFYVCIGDQANIAGCAGGPADTICSVATTTDNISCNFTDTAPTIQGSYTYNAFMFDSFNAAAADNFRASSYTINNAPPQIGPLVLNGNSSITLNLKGAGGTSVSTVVASVTELNGCDSGLVGASAAIYMSNVVDGYSCTPNDSVCYQINPLSCVKSGCTGSGDMTASYTCSTSLEHFAVPTDASDGNPWTDYNWLSYISIYDGDNYVSTTSAGVELNTSIALDVSEDYIDFGSDLYVGDNTGNKNSTTTITNLGNSPINTEISGTNMTGNPSGTINVDNIEWEQNNFSWSFGTPLSTIDQEVNINAPNPINSSDVFDRIYWGIGIPLGANASVYYGQNNFSVKLDATSWQNY